MARKILVVGDFHDLSEMLGTGWNPILAESGRKALDILEQETPVHSPGHTTAGYKRLRRAAILKKHRVYRSLPILAATAFLTLSPGSGVLRQAAIISFPSLAKLVS
jgi:hypothetical protein